ncbi:MAG: DUF1963 domain-containing protein [Ktedonobacteraceae bacterium]|nr:DUF1963 domain-containing protein [Ktedonobacteraceae bacterium]
MIHERLNIDYWKQQFSLPRLSENMGVLRPGVRGVSGPLDMAVLEQVRDASYAREPGIERVPTDIFIWSRGEPDQRAMTKVGGLPYRAAEAPWPLAPCGTPLTFVAQICFADSHDIIPALPGDILLLFAEAKNWGSGENPHYNFLFAEAKNWDSEEDLLLEVYDEKDSYLWFEWVSLGEFPLVSRELLPETSWQILPCYGTIHRSWDYPHVNGFAYQEITEHIPPVIEATKIGGICPWSEIDWTGYSEEETEGYLCSLRSLDNEIRCPFPFLNVPEPINGDEWKHSQPLNIGDGGIINFFLKPDKTLRWRFHGY